ncbi:RHS repeat-associated core domain-containing protein [Myxococcota bacterium]|nr:RHS repeat-associated core domain-containing protein [Myxococcota bacterium]
MRAHLEPRPPHLYDYDADLYLARARVLDPRTGAFLQRDPSGYEDSVNLYAGFRNNPINNRDPDGQESVPDVSVSVPDPIALLNSGFAHYFSGWFGGQADSAGWKPSMDGVGGVWGGLVRAAALRLIPVESRPTVLSRVGMDVGAGLVPVLDPFMRLMTGQTASGQEASRVVAGAELVLQLFSAAQAVDAAGGTAGAAARTNALSFSKRAFTGDAQKGIRPATIISDLEQTAIGRETLALRDVLDTQVVLRKGAPHGMDTSGVFDADSNVVEIALGVCKNKQRAAETIVHEMTHAAGFRGSQRAEVIAQMRARKHELGRMGLPEELPFGDIRAIIEWARKNYTNLPRGRRY